VAKQLKGAFALAVIHEAFPHTLVAISRGCPLVVGVGIDEHLIASDVLALAPFVQSVLYLEDGDSVSLSTTHYEIFDSASAEVTRQLQPLDSHNHTISKGSYKHFMLKEIHEQPRVLADALKGRIESQEALRASIFADTNYENIKQIHIIACGTSYHAGLVARLWLESLAGIATQVEVASEFRYRDVVVMENTLFLTISQSGETADTLAALEKAKKLPYAGYMAICNVATSTLVRQSEIAFLTRAGVEIGVASTKAFTTQLAALLMLAAALSPSDKAQEIITELESLPAICERVLQMEKEIAALSQLFLLKSHTLFVGRGVQYPVALEGALKLKEISYIHAEAYPAGELKHGPLALIDKDIPVIAIASKDILLDKLKSNIEEVSARGGQLVILMEEEETWKFDGAYLVRVPHCGSIIAPIVYTLPLQLLAYYVAVAKGTDVDQPRNLAKSVTVE
jgi:glucosamine--fructose-6-phosphate aminotransferase (isomerizing)